MRLASFLLVACAVSPAFAQAPSASPPPKPAAADPVAEKAAAITEAASLLQKASQAKARGNRNFAEQLFSSAELILGPDALSDIAPLFREGAPPRVQTPLKVLPKDTPPQPAVVGGSDEEEPDAKPKRGSLSGNVKLEGKAWEGRAVVTLEPVNGKFHRRAARHRIMEQRDREFAPKVLMVPVGSTVSFPNFDTIYHNVFSRSEALQFDLGIYRNGQSRELTFDKPGIVRLGCNLHSNMSAYIVVVDAPHYVVSDDKGHFSFKSLEPGKYKLRAWSERSLQPVTKEITIAPEANSVAVSVPADAPADKGVDKFGVARGK